MWFCKIMWTVLTTSFLIYTSSAYSSYSDFDTAISGQYPSLHKGFRWAELDAGRNLFDTDTQRDISGKYLEQLNSWPGKDSLTLTRHLFGDKAVESSENLRSPAGDATEEEDISINKRESHSLSIVNPLDVLRQRLMLEMARRRMKENQDQIRQNEVILKNLGKRSGFHTSHESIGEQRVDEMRTHPDYLKRIQVSSSEDFDV